MIKRISIATAFLLLLTSNVLSITSSAFHDKLFSALSKIPVHDLLKDSPKKKQQNLVAENKSVKEKNQRLTSRQRELESQNRKIKNSNRKLLENQRIQKLKLKEARSISRRIANRTARNVTRNASSVIAESIPYLGVAVVVSVTALDIKDGCATVRDVNEIIRTLDPEDSTHDENEVCGVKLPSSDQVLSKIKTNIKTSIDHSADRTKETAKEFYDALGGTLYEILN